MDKAVNLYIATSIKPLKRQRGCYLYILETQTAKGPATITKKEILDEGTQNQSILLALCAALKRLRMSCSLHIYLDCAYVAAAIKQEWIKDWEYHNWQNKKGRQVTDAEIWQEVSSLLKPHTFFVCENQPHPYKEWMKMEVEKWKDTH